MVQKIRVESLCDLCFEDDNVEEPSTHTQVLGIGTAILELDWCDNHDQKGFRLCDLIDLFREYGHKPPTSGPTVTGPRRRQSTTPRGDEGDFPCPIDGCPKHYQRKSYLDGHLRWHNGDPGYGCDQPDCTQNFQTYQALGLHKDRAHGIPSPFKNMSFSKRKTFVEKDKEKALAIAKSR